MQHYTFEDYLKEQFWENCPSVLDDELPDAFDDWLGNLDTQELIDYAEDAIRKVRADPNKSVIPF